MLKHQHKRYQPIRLTLPDGTNGLIMADRRCAVFYDFPPEVKIEPANHHQKVKTDSTSSSGKTD
ncbi:hypothetical protein [Xenorhabdus szentirmaii]|uniref:hypothetical protein n=1 Tax=Xenorhabdus szentirmaii TaxID=290112 RepID=UPI000571E246|nr:MULTISPECIES: hypothetical protein [Xenorhabdus]MBD2822803.1 hypothetical protein [Xenorhabdus sp. 42]PHM32090.1 hypothetical protein Xsze_02820 [Xenorhabdus szentirmaii DSM 16338]PHM41617.1 hypothetical protein Xszus_01310 [Xenorhabdus szentirmaii]